MGYLQDLKKEIETPVEIPTWLRWAVLPIPQAFILSLLFHLLLAAIWETAYLTGFVAIDPADLFQKNILTPEMQNQLVQIQENLQEEVPLTFIDVEPVEEVEPPPNARYYSSASTRAGNPQPTLVEQDTPFVEGVEQEIVKTSDTVHTKDKYEELTPIQQNDTPQLPVQEVQERASEDPLVPPKQDMGISTPTKKERPRTLRQVRKNANIAGNATKMNGGSRRHLLSAQMDVKGTPFGNYDAAFIAAVQKRWYDLIDSAGLLTGSGKVVVAFQLHSDGHISAIQVLSTTVGELQTLLCQRAIMDPAPYNPWPSELRHAVHGDVRSVKFTFYYN